MSNNRDSNPSSNTPPEQDAIRHTIETSRPEAYSPTRSTHSASYSANDSTTSLAISESAIFPLYPSRRNRPFELPSQRRDREHSHTQMYQQIIAHITIPTHLFSYKLWCEYHNAPQPVYRQICFVVEKYVNAVALRFLKKNGYVYYTMPLGKLDEVMAKTTSKAIEKARECIRYGLWPQARAFGDGTQAGAWTGEVRFVPRPVRFSLD